MLPSPAPWLSCCHCLLHHTPLTLTCHPHAAARPPTVQGLLDRWDQLTCTDQSVVYEVVQRVAIAHPPAWEQLEENLRLLLPALDGAALPPHPGSAPAAAASPAAAAAEPSPLLQRVQQMLVKALGFDPSAAGPANAEDPRKLPFHCLACYLAQATSPAKVRAAWGLVGGTFLWETRRHTVQQAGISKGGSIEMRGRASAVCAACLVRRRHCNLLIIRISCFSLLPLVRAPTVWVAPPDLSPSLLPPYVCRTLCSAGPSPHQA